MARHSAPQSPFARRALLAVTTAGVALGAGAGTAAAADGAAPVVDVLRARPASLGSVDPQQGSRALIGTVGYVTGPVAPSRPTPSPVRASTRSTTVWAPGSPTSRPSGRRS